MFATKSGLHSCAWKTQSFLASCALIARWLSSLQRTLELLTTVLSVTTSFLKSALYPRVVTIDKVYATTTLPNPMTALTLSDNGNKKQPRTNCPRYERSPTHIIPSLPMNTHSSTRDLALLCFQSLTTTTTRSISAGGPTDAREWGQTYPMTKQRNNDSDMYSFVQQSAF